MSDDDQGPKGEGQSETVQHNDVGRAASIAAALPGRAIPGNFAPNATGNRTVTTSVIAPVEVNADFRNGFNSAAPFIDDDEEDEDHIDTVAGADVTVALQGVEARAETGGAGSGVETTIASASGRAAGDVQVQAAGRATRGTISFTPEIWNTQGGNPFVEIDSARRELEAVRAYALAWKAQNATNPRADNGPPGLVDDPDIDIEAVDAAIQCLTVLRPLLSQPEPDIELLKLLWRVVTATLRIVKRFAAWAWGGVKEFESTVLGKAITGAVGVNVGNDGYKFVMSQISQHGPQGLQYVEQLLKGALAALGHAV